MSYFERAAKLLQKRKRHYWVSHELLAGMAREMYEAARQLRHAERFVSEEPSEEGKATVAYVRQRIAESSDGSIDLVKFGKEVPDGQGE